jgi:mRNA interferase MazF
MSAREIYETTIRPLAPIERLRLSSRIYHNTRPEVIIGLVTSQVTSAATPTDRVIADWRQAGLRKPSAFRAFLTTLPSSLVISRLGRLSDSDWRAVQDCVKRAIELP